MAKIPDPFPGLIISYSYLWKHEYKAGQEEGRKDRPCAIILSKHDEDGENIVTVAPITHSIPQNPDMAVEIPLAVKNHLNLDLEKSWIICNEVNRFVWPGHDLRTTNIDGKTAYTYGVLPPKLFAAVKNTIIQSLAKIIRRS